MCGDIVQSQTLMQFLRTRTCTKIENYQPNKTEPKRVRTNKTPDERNLSCRYSGLQFPQSQRPRNSERSQLKQDQVRVRHVKWNATWDESLAPTTLAVIFFEPRLLFATKHREMNFSAGRIIPIPRLAISSGLLKFWSKELTRTGRWKVWSNEFTRTDLWKFWSNELTCTDLWKFWSKDLTLTDLWKFWSKELTRTDLWKLWSNELTRTDLWKL